MIIRAADFSNGFTFRSEARVKGERERETVVVESWANVMQQLSANGFDEEITRRNKAKCGFAYLEWNLERVSAVSLKIKQRRTAMCEIVLYTER